MRNVALVCIVVVFLSSFGFAGEPNPSEYAVDFKVLSSGHVPAETLALPTYSHGTVYNGIRTKEVCSMEVTDGQFVYYIQNADSFGNRVQWGSCVMGYPNYHYNGRIRGNTMELLTPNGKKVKVRKYAILQRAPVEQPK